MGYPAQISGADDDPVMMAIRAKFAQQQQPATGMPTDILPQHVRAAAQAAVLSKNSNAKNSAVNAQIAAMQSDPAIMQQIMETYGPDMAAQYAGGGNGAVQQPQAIQRTVPSAAETPIEEAAEGLSSSPAEEVAEATMPNVQSPAGMPTGTAPVAPSGMDPALAAALGLTGGVAGGAGGMYLANKLMNRQPAAPQMRGAVPGDFDAQMPPSAAAAAVPNAAPAPAAPPAASKQIQAAIMGESELPPTATAMPEPPPAAPMPEVFDESGIPEHMRSNVDSRSAPVTRRTQRLAKDANMNDAHMQSIIMEGSGADTTPSQAPVAEAAPTEQTAPAKRTRKSTKKAASAEAPTEGTTETAKPAKAKRTNGKRTASATPNAEGGTDYVHTDVATAKAALKASKAKKEQTLAEKVDTVAAESAAPAAPEPVKEKKTRKPRTPKAKTEAPAETAAPAATDDRMPEQPKPELRKKTKSRLDVPTGPGAKASKGMTLAEARELLKPEPDLSVIDKFEAYDMNEQQFNALKEAAKDVIRAAKGAAPGNPKKAKTNATAAATVDAPAPTTRTSYVYDDKNEAILKAIKEPLVVERVGPAAPKRKMLTPAEATARLLAKRAGK